MPGITHVTSTTQLDSILTAVRGKVSVIDFHATWCGPCHQIAPVFEALSKQYPHVNFLKCDVDAARDVASRYSVSAMPTFIFLRDSTKIDQIKGADKSGLQSMVAKYASSSSSATAIPVFTGKGHSLGGSKPTTSVTAVPSIPDLGSIDPKTKTLGLLVLAYLVLWWMS